MKRKDVLEDFEKDFLWSLATNKQAEAAKILKNNFQLENIIGYCVDNRIEHYFYEFLKDNDLLDLLKKEYIQLIKNSIEIRAKKSLIIYQKAMKILDEFTTKDIKYVALKGMSYVEYSNTFKRPIRDIDVLIDHNDIEKAVDIAFKNGFRFKNHKKFSKDLILNGSDIYDLPDLIDSNNVCLEIHYKILRDSESKTCKLSNNLFKDVKYFSIYGNVIKTSSLSSCISHLIYHASKKGNFDIGIGPIFDLNFLSQFISEKDMNNIRNISDECGFKHESESFLELIENKNLSDNVYLLKELILSPNINTKIQEFFLHKSFFQKSKDFYKLLFVSKKHIRREFQTKENFLLRRYFARWLRQFSQLSKYIYLLIFKRGIFKKRAELIRRFYKN
tara:strand:- start:24064 stop:25230 length:1167 start_codon:yes stop_codon:yes gene_type:complete